MVIKKRTTGGVMTAILNKNPDPLLSSDEAGIYLGVHRKTPAIWRARKKFLDILPSVLIGNRRYYRQSTLENFLRIRTSSGSGTSA